MKALTRHWYVAMLRSGSVLVPDAAWTLPLLSAPVYTSRVRYGPYPPLRVVSQHRDFHTTKPAAKRSTKSSTSSVASFVASWMKRANSAVGGASLQVEATLSKSKKISPDSRHDEHQLDKIEALLKELIAKTDERFNKIEAMIKEDQTEQLAAARMNERYDKLEANVERRLYQMSTGVLVLSLAYALLK